MGANPTGRSGRGAPRLDALDAEEAYAALTRCCGASRWVEAMLARRPFGTRDALLAAADDEWARMRRADVLEAFAHHPRIGDDVEALRAKFAGKGDLAASAREQAGVARADDATLLALRDGNREYERRFGHIFIVCATGKSAAEMLALLRARLGNAPDDELRIAAAEQAKITRLRLAPLAAT